MKRGLLSSIRSHSFLFPLRHVLINRQCATFMQFFARRTTKLERTRMNESKKQQRGKFRHVLLSMIVHAPNMRVTLIY